MTDSQYRFMLTISSFPKTKFTPNFGKEPTRSSEYFPEHVSRRRGRRRLVNFCIYEARRRMS